MRQEKRSFLWIDPFLVNKPYLTVFILFLTPWLMAGEANSAVDTKTAILSIEKSIYDLTDMTVLLRSQPFLSFRENVNEARAAEIVCLIQSGELKSDAALIGLFAIEALPEERYWAVTAPLLSHNTDQGLLARVLVCPFPYGPGYVNSSKDDSLKAKLKALESAPECDETVKNWISFILSGEGAKAYARFKRDPKQFGYPPKYLEPRPNKNHK
jgi:hypothetical protein